jgi:type IV secretory pathway VirB10-like protein
MSNTKSLVIWGVGSVAVFAVAFAGVALVRGVSLREVPPLSWVAPHTPADAHATGTREPAPPPPAPEPRATPAVPPMTAGVLGAFVMPSPFDARELQELQARLQKGLEHVASEERRLAQRERDLDDWQRTLEERERDVAAQRGAVEHAGTAADASKTAQPSKVQDTPESWRALAPLFAEGDPDELAKKLATFEPAAAAQILRGMDPERAAAVLNALPKERFKDFLDAWRLAGD